MAEAFSKRQPKQNDQGPFQYNEAVEISIQSPSLGYVVNSRQIKYTPVHVHEEIKRYNPLLNSLEHALSKPLFCCGGSLQPPNMDDFVLTVKTKTSEAEEEPDWKEYELPNLPLDKLLEYCNPAPFGDLNKMKTVLDSEVRLAYEVESERFEIEGGYDFYDWTASRMTSEIPGGTWIQKHIEDSLTPGRYVKLDRYKLNVYKEGGFFKPHVDSPSGDEMIGTLVLCLPSPHKGGELCVSHDGLQHVFDFSQHSGDTTRVQWAAFYSDCIHEVKPVLEGHRVTVTYNITLPTEHYRQRRYKHSDEPKDDAVSLEEHFEASAESPSISAKVLSKVNTELEKIRQQGRSSPSRIGFLLKHKYISKGLQPRLLKGEDKALFDFLIEKQWKCSLMSVLSRYHTDATYPFGGGEDGCFVESHEIYEFKPLPSGHPVTVQYGAPPKRNRPREVRSDRRGIPFIDIYRKAENGEQLVRNNKGGGGWIGNEVEDVGVDKIYLDSAVIVNLCEEP